MRIALYARVSTEDQDTENQLTQLREWCVRSGHEIVREYVEHESGRTGTNKRQEFGRMFDDASRRRFDCVLFWALDRFSREGMVPTILHLQRLTSYGVAFHSYTEPHLATDNELARNIILATLSSLAKVEAQKISERTKAGLARARAKGKRIGRPRIAVELDAAVRASLAQGTGVVKTARALGCGVGTVQRIKGEMAA
jgi:DNA invertase Pin-like site-specific DNA recombinase